MKIQQIYTGCLAQGAYYIESNGEAAVIDPLREIDQYLNLAKERKAVIKYIFETHFHADFVSGRIPYVTANELATILQRKNVNTLDVRKKSEFDSEHIVGALNSPLDYIDENSIAIDESDTYYVHCAGGYRSMIFTSILKARGYENLVDVEGGFTAIKETGKFDLSEYVCPTTML